MKTIKTQMKDIQVGDVVVIRYAEEKVFAKVDSITEEYQKNGVRIVTLWRSNEEVAMGKAKGIWQAKETTFVQKQKNELQVDQELSQIMTNIVFKNKRA